MTPEEDIWTNGEWKRPNDGSDHSVYKPTDKPVAFKFKDWKSTRKAVGLLLVAGLIFGLFVLK